MPANKGHKLVIQEPGTRCESDNGSAMQSGYIEERMQELHLAQFQDVPLAPLIAEPHMRLLWIFPVIFLWLEYCIIDVTNTFPKSRLNWSLTTLAHIMQAFPQVFTSIYIYIYIHTAFVRRLRAPAVARYTCPKSPKYGFVEETTDHGCGSKTVWHPNSSQPAPTNQAPPGLYL